MESDSLIDHAKIKAQLDHILSDGEFKRSKILTGFLKFVVTETLQGRGDALKEYTIGVNVLNKSVVYDTQSDAIVRVHAMRLRTALDAYYENGGFHAPIRIFIPKGVYKPVFQKNNVERGKGPGTAYSQPKTPDAKPSIAVLPFRSFQKDERIKVISFGICEEISTAFTRFEGLRVVSFFASVAASEKINDPIEVAHVLDADYLLTGSCYREGDEIKITVELVSVNHNHQIWAESYKVGNIQDERLGYYSEIIHKVISSVGGNMGMIYKDALSSIGTEDYTYLYAIYWSNRFHIDFTAEAAQEAEKAVKIALERFPDSPMLLAIQASFYLNLKAIGAPDEDDHLKLGTQLVRKAVDLDPQCQMANQVMAWANILNHDKRGFTRSIEKMVSINPYDAMHSAQAGFGYICVGEYDKGFRYMNEAIELNPHYPWNITLSFCFYFLHSGEFEDAYAWGRLINRKGFLWDPLLRVAALGFLGKSEKAAEVISELYALCPDFPSRAPQIVATFLLDEKLQHILLDGLEKAGVKSETWRRGT